MNSTTGSRLIPSVQHTFISDRQADILFFSLYLLPSCHVPISSLCQFTVHLGLGCLVGQRRWYNGIGCQGWSVSWYRFGLENEERREAGGIEGVADKEGSHCAEYINKESQRVVIKRADNG